MDTTSKVTPTPGPWVLDSGEHKGTGGEQVYKIVKDGQYGGLIGETSAWYYDRYTAEANAARIVHCVNTYPALVKALEELVLYHDADNELQVTMYPQSIEYARQTLTLARKESGV